MEPLELDESMTPEDDVEDTPSKREAQDKEAAFWALINDLLIKSQYEIHYVGERDIIITIKHYRLERYKHACYTLSHIYGVFNLDIRVKNTPIYIYLGVYRRKACEHIRYG